MAAPDDRRTPADTCEPRSPSHRSADHRLTVIAVIAVGVALKLMQPVLVLLLVALMVTYLFDPVLFMMRRHLRLPLWAAVSLTGILALAVLSAIGAIVTVGLVEFTRDFDPARFDQTIDDTIADVERILGFSFSFEEQPAGSLETALEDAVNMAQSVLRGLSSFVVVFFFALLFLAAKGSMALRSGDATPDPHTTAPEGILRAIDRSLRRFIVVRTLISLLVATATTLILLAFGVRFAVVWGLLTFLLNFIPTVGSIVAVLVPSLFAVAQLGLGLTPIAVAACLATAQVLTGSVLEPKLHSDALDLSLVVVFVSLLFWGWLWGPVGALLAVPIAAGLRIVLANIPATAPLARYMAGRKREPS